MRELSFPAGSRGPKMDAACIFAVTTCKKAGIGALKDLSSILGGDAGATIAVNTRKIEWS